MKEEIEKMYVQALIDDLPPNVFADQVLRLFSVVGRSEPCDFFHSTDWNGKCFKCGEQVFVREPK